MPQTKMRPDNKPITDAELATADRVLALKPSRRSACVDGIRPCPWVTCRYHAWTDLYCQNRNLRPSPTWGNPNVTCVLDWCRTSRTLEEVGRLLNVSREFIRRVEARAFARMRRDDKLRDYATGSNNVT